MGVPLVIQDVKAIASALLSTPNEIFLYLKQQTKQLEELTAFNFKTTGGVVAGKMSQRNKKATYIRDTSHKDIDETSYVLLPLY